MNFDPTINFGQILVASSFLFALAGFYFRTQGKLDSIQRQIDRSDSDSREWRNKIEKELGTQTEILVIIGKQEERMTSADKRIDELARRIDSKMVIASNAGNARAG